MILPAPKSNLYVLECVQGLAVQISISNTTAQEEAAAPAQLVTANTSPLCVRGIVCVFIAALASLWALL
jgi:hypothetical protein